MATPYEQGQQDVIHEFNHWEEIGWSSLKEMMERNAQGELEELAAARQRGDERHEEYFKGRLSRYD